MLGIRSGALGGWLLAAGVVGTAVAGACADKKGALMLAINTDMRAPKDVNAVSVTISTNGAIKHSFIGRVTPQGEVLLPATLAIVQPDDAGATIRVRVMAFQNTRPRVLRDVRTTVPTGGRTALLRIPLNFVNDGMVNGPSLPAGIVPDPAPGTGAETPEGGTSSGSPSGGGTSGTSGTGGTADGGTSGSTSGDGSAFGTTAGDFDFMAAFQPPCTPPDGNIQNQTIIDGQCADNYVDPATLPDFDSAQLGDSTDVGTCFDLARCFAGAVHIAETGSGAGGATDAGARASDDSGAPAPAVDAGTGGKDFHPAAVTLDRIACALQLNGANPDRLNLAIVTPDTGECVAPGECYVPIDRGVGGWKEQDGRVQLPTFVCTLLTSRNLRLVTSSDVCAAKEEKNPICTPKIGDDAGITTSPAAVRIVPEEFATSVAFSGADLFYASASRIGRVGSPDGAATVTGVPNIQVGGDAHLPWRFSNAQFGGSLGLANGSSVGYALANGGASANPITIAPGTVDVAFINSDFAPFAWGVSGASGGLYTSTATGSATRSPAPVTDVTAMSGGTGLLVVGDTAGNVRSCILPDGGCSAPALVPGGGRIEGFAPILAQAGGGGAFVLSQTGVAVANVFTQGGTTGDGGMTTTSTVQISPAIPADTGGIDEGALHYAHGIATNAACLFFSTKTGIEYSTLSSAGGSGGTLVAAPSGTTILGLSVGPSALYYAVYAPSMQGGGVWRVPLPASCTGGSITPGKDGGTGTDAGADDASADAGPQCGPGNCPTGCCTTSNVCLDFMKAQQSNTACGSMGGKCQDCTLLPASCAPMGVSGGICGG